MTVSAVDICCLSTPSQLLTTMVDLKFTGVSWAFLCCLLFITAIGKVALAAPAPHILFILVSDLGWHDVGWRDPDFRTPFLDLLRAEGVELDQHYTQPSSTPARVALTTGRYPYSVGVQSQDGLTYYRHRNFSLSLDFKLLQQYLQDNNYSTHLVGKWRLGFCNWSYTPLQRGFETFYGSLGGNADYFNHTANIMGGYDFRSGYDVKWTQGQYATTLFTDRVVDIISNHSASRDRRRLFIHLGHEAVHKPLQAPEKYQNICSHINNHYRKLRCAMMAAVDEGVEKIMRVVSDVGYDNKFLVVFTSDNGASGNAQFGGMNYPLRGRKLSVYEGGTRVPTFLYSNNTGISRKKALLPDAPYVYSGLMHIADWLPTLLKVAKAKSASLPTNTDGVDMWKSIVKQSDSARKQMVYDIDREQGSGAVRDGKWKLVHYSGFRGPKCLGWFNFPTSAGSKRPKKVNCEEWELYDLESDPSEETDLSQSKPKTLDTMKEIYSNINESAVYPWPVIVDVPESYPENWDGVWTPYGC